MSIRGHPNIAVALEPNQDGSFQLSSIIWLQMVVLVSPTPFLSYLSFFFASSDNTTHSKGSPKGQCRLSDLGLSFHILLCWNLGPDSASLMLQEREGKYEILSNRA